VYVVQEPPADPNLAHYPEPPVGAMHDDLWATLFWSPGRYATSHDVYIGNNFDDVNNGTGDTFWGYYSERYVIIGFPDYADRSRGLVVPGATIYWRVDEVNDMHPDSPWKGDVWSFMIQPETAYNPYPSDGTELIDPNVTLSWMAGFHAKSHTVYFGDNFDDVNNATGGPMQKTTSYAPGLLEFDKTYYWRVDEFDGYTTYKGAIWSFRTKPTDPNLAHYPWPSDGAMYTETWICCSWTPGRHAVSHDVYFGDNYDDVYNGSGDTYWGNYSHTFFVYGFLDYAGSPGLIPGNTYYWRIDEVNDLHPDSPWKGDVWSFWLPPYTAYDPIPVDEAELIDPNVTLSWTAGFGSKLHYLYFGENLANVEAGTSGTFKGYLSKTIYFPGPLEFDKTYYWRIDEFDWTTHKGEVWSFTTCSLIAYEPYPPDGIIFGSQNVVISWKAGLGAMQHDVYFGTDFDDVNNADISDSSGVYRGRSAETSYAPEVLEPYRIYYWRIDEVQDDGVTVHKGKVCSFTVAEAGVVTYQVSASEDDGYAFNPSAQNLQTDCLKVGYSGFARPPYYMSGMIFKNVNIPPGSVILSARLKVRSYNSNQTGTVYARIEAEATDDAGGFSGSRRIDTLPTTNASVDWIIEEPWSANTWYESPDFAGVIQEVIDRPGWPKGNSLVILLSTSSEGGYRNFSSYDYGSDYAPILEIQY
jgi:hypothetical protein